MEIINVTDVVMLPHCIGERIRIDKTLISLHIIKHPPKNDKWNNMSRYIVVRIIIHDTMYHEKRRMGYDFRNNNTHSGIVCGAFTKNLFFYDDKSEG